MEGEIAASNQAESLLKLIVCDSLAEIETSFKYDHRLPAKFQKDGDLFEQALEIAIGIKSFEGHPLVQRTLTSRVADAYSDIPSKSSLSATLMELLCSDVDSGYAMIVSVILTDVVQMSILLFLRDLANFFDLLLYFLSFLISILLLTSAWDEQDEFIVILSNYCWITLSVIAMATLENTVIHQIYRFVNAGFFINSLLILLFWMVKYKDSIFEKKL